MNDKLVQLNKLQTITSQLHDILETPVSVQILEQLNEKQILKLRMMIENIVKPNKGAFYYQNAEDSRTEILSLLDFGKNKLKPKHYSDRTNNYLNAKKLI